MSFIDEKPWVVSKEDLKRPWSGGRNGKYFLCGLCGKKFVEGDEVRWVYLNGVTGSKYGNITIHVGCDLGSREKIAEKRNELGKDFDHLCKVFHVDLEHYYRT